MCSLHVGHGEDQRCREMCTPNNTLPMKLFHITCTSSYTLTLSNINTLLRIPAINLIVVILDVAITIVILTIIFAQGWIYNVERVL